MKWHYMAMNKHPQSTTKCCSANQTCTRCPSPTNKLSIRFINVSIRTAIWLKHRQNSCATTTKSPHINLFCWFKWLLNHLSIISFVDGCPIFPMISPWSHHVDDFSIPSGHQIWQWNIIHFIDGFPSYKPPAIVWLCSLASLIYPTIIPWNPG